MSKKLVVPKRNNTLTIEVYFSKSEISTEACLLPKAVGQCDEKIPSWYYDAGSKECEAFNYGGCLGNNNRFVTKAACEQKCINLQPLNVCRLPKMKGPCSGSFTQWYYDQDQEDCLEFLFTGCQGNGNRFNSKEGCYQQCKKDRLTTPAPLVMNDVCTLPQQPGPCLGYYRMWYYDNYDNICKSFVYGGCEGNGNRFEKRTECEVHCVKNTKEPSPKIPPPQGGINEAVCRLPVNPGPCNEAHPRWFYDAQTQSCLPFIFGGCNGNRNRFKTSEICRRFCTGIKAISSQDPVSTLTSTLAPTTQCPPSICSDIQCPYHIHQSFDINGCSICRCSNPCEVHNCPVGSRCAIDVVSTSREGIRTDPVCRRVKKPGECASNSSFSFNASDCKIGCRDDADCRGEQKCCPNGCDLNCASPGEPVSIRTGVNVTEGRVSESTELPCDATGWPRPTVTWWRETTLLPVSSLRYEQLSNYSLLIRSLVREDAGDYTCIAHNGIGTGTINRVTLVIHQLEDDDLSSFASTLMPSTTTELVSEDSKCVDNPQFNNCMLIVQANYCKNKFYGKYCCASCLKAGKLRIILK